MQKTRHVIIDNETLDVTPSAVLLTIGAVAVEISGDKAIILGSWYRHIRHQPTTWAQPNRSVGLGTLQWWFGQNDPAYFEAFAATERTHLWLAMHSLNAWLSLNPYPIWGNGADFDNAQLQNAFNQLGLRWPYHRNRCLRSLKGLVLDLHPDTKLPEFPANKIKHHALHDAEHEGHVLAALLHVLDRSAWLELRLHAALHREHNLLANTAALMRQRDQSLSALEAIADPRQTASRGDPTALRNYARAAIATAKGNA